MNPYGADSDLQTTILKTDLLAALRKKIVSVEAKHKTAEKIWAQRHARHVQKVARILEAAASDIRAGTLGADGNWCAVRRGIENQIGESPEKPDDPCANMRAAIFQVEHARGTELTVRTTQIEMWLGGRTVPTGRRRR